MRLANWGAGGTSQAFRSDEVVARNLKRRRAIERISGCVMRNGAELALRSRRGYLSSARRALDHDELVSVGNFGGAGAALATADTALHAELLLVGCGRSCPRVTWPPGSPLVDDLERIAGDALAPWAICYRCQLVVYRTTPAAGRRRDLQEAIDEFARRGDAAGLAGHTGFARTCSGPARAGG